jgi:hypothetical protein
MSEPKELLLLVEQLRRSNRRWKALALVACCALALAAFASYLSAVRERMRVEVAMRHVQAALVASEEAAKPGLTK